MKFNAMLLVAALGLAAATCPNQCSGHGRCGEFDKCVCFRSTGSTNPYRFAYTGADCSQRTCPVGRAFGAVTATGPELSPVTFIGGADTSKEKLRVFFSAAARTSAFLALRRDQTFSVKIMSVGDFSAGNYGTFTWKFEEDPYYQPETAIELSTNPESARELVTTVGGETVGTGVFVWFDATYKGSEDLSEIAAGDTYSFTLAYNGGFSFDESDSNTAHQETECSGQGECDSSTGKCKCFKGFTGAACERTECPNGCSGHGTCQAEARFVTDGNKAAGYSNTYSDAYDGKQQYGCRCDNGYRGADCSQVECPSAADPMGGEGGEDGRDCSGRGTCDYSTGACQCFKGFAGEACDLLTAFA